MPSTKKSTAKKSTTKKSTAKKSTTKKAQEVYRVKGKKVVAKVKELIKEGNVRRVTIKDSKGKTILVMPVTVGVIGAVLAAPLVVIGAIAAMVTECEISVERAK
jgi:hypothetical protein